MKKYLRFILPLLVVVLIVVLAVVSKFNKKPSGKDLYISFEEEETSEEDKYIDGVYESVVKPNYEVKVDDDTGLENVITDDFSIAVDDSDKEILIKNDDGNLEVIKISDLMQGNNPTNNNTSLPSDEEGTNTENLIPMLRNDGLGGSTVYYLPKSMAYDTALINRDGIYAGCLYGKYLYRIEEKYMTKYDIDNLLVIASYTSNILLGNDSIYEIWLEDGFIIKKGGDE